MNALDDAGWQPWDWQQRVAAQQPEWPDPEALDAVIKELAQRPALVVAKDVDRLRAALARAARGRAFVLQAGDCAESFHDHSASSLRAKLKIILQMAVVLTYSSGVSVVKIGRIAGQFAKPRSAPVEVVDGATLPSFRGHIVHDDAPTLDARRPNPERLLWAYDQSRATVSVLRALTEGASRISPGRIGGTSTSSPRRRKGSATRRSPMGSIGHFASWQAAGSISSARPFCTK